MKRSLVLAAGLLALAAPFPAGELRAQDVEMLGRRYGTVPPAAYFERIRRDPAAFRFERGWRARVEQLRQLDAGPGPEAGRPLDGGEVRWSSIVAPTRAAGASGGASGTSSARSGLGARAGGVSGRFDLPVVLGLFADTSVYVPFSRELVQQEFFDGPNSRYITIPEFYAEISGGLLDMRGHSWDWERTGLTRAQVTGGDSGLDPTTGQVGEYIVETLDLVEASNAVDWGLFDNDGPDGTPNSGDDDGYVDVLVVVHPDRGAECGGSGRGDRIWSHRWVLTGWVGQPYTTGSASANGGSIRINDYTIQPAYSCDGSTINEIGVFAHELGHAFGLPDLYDTDGGHEGIGSWGLMGSGSWGCNNSSPESPCHMSAWSKAVLGWLEVVDLAADTDHGTLSLDAVETSGRVYRVRSGSDASEYFLLENRQPIGSDQSLRMPGLLVWHVDDDIVEAGWPSNDVNSGTRLGVWLRQADGFNTLATSTGNRGDAGDPFPGSTANTAFHTSTSPSSRDHAGRSSAVTLTDLTHVDGRIGFRLRTFYRDLTFRTEGVSSGQINVDGSARSAVEFTVASSPFQVHAVEASAGIEESEGVRTAFVEWADGAERVRQVTTGLSDSTLVARYGGTEYLLDVSLQSAIQGIVPGELASSPASEDLWYPAGTQVALEARARTGFRFLRWDGGLAGQPNPATVLMDEPRSGSALFEQAFGVDDVGEEVTFQAAVQQEIILEAVDANDPVSWSVQSGQFPPGIVLDPQGRLLGAALDTGRFEVTFHAVDGIGLQATSAPVVLRVTPPVIGEETLAAPFLLGGGGPTPEQRAYLDRHGNGSGSYDLGDLRAFLLANPGTPATATQPEAAPTLLRLEMRPAGDRAPGEDETPKREES